MVMRRLKALLPVLLLTGCSVLQGTPQPPPPLTDKPQEIRRDQTEGLQRMGSVTALVYGSPADAEEAIHAKAVAANADYYVIIMIDETIVPAQWYSQAILYRK
ncbi:biofilm peroxide resistance protein BsmA [Pseudenterobacter timonensis]|uniref:Biofilm peroxide resistance protein BsmA n=1 Tax=Pseudenterobacter timonensis TaxID=1755099 RepID=A0AAE4DJP7_9ENTR|nr:biofilm peroxide resistance protein BsmA [Pseudenterobacter timonensis]MDR9889078.1 biofilm peroxide resistance protein BsmA [Pseudenterobacter timonensis]